MMRYCVCCGEEVPKNTEICPFCSRIVNEDYFAEDDDYDDTDDYDDPFDDTDDYDDDDEWDDDPDDDDCFW